MLTKNAIIPNAVRVVEQIADFWELRRAAVLGIANSNDLMGAKAKMLRESVIAARERFQSTLKRCGLDGFDALYLSAAVDEELCRRSDADWGRVQFRCIVRAEAEERAERALKAA